MDRNAVIAIAATVLLYFGWQWSLDQRYPDRNKERPAATEGLAEGPAPRPADPAAPTGGSSLPAASQAADSPTALPERTITIDRPDYRARLSTRGGALTGWSLVHYDDASISGRPRIELVTADDGRSLATPLQELGAGDLSRLDYAVREPSPGVVEFTADVGGALRMNAGAMGVETFDQVVSVTFLDEDGEIRERSRDEIVSNYRDVPELRRNFALQAVFAGTPEFAAVALRARGRSKARAHLFRGSRFFSWPTFAIKARVFQEAGALVADIPNRQHSIGYRFPKELPIGQSAR